METEHSNLFITTITVEVHSEYLAVLYFWSKHFFKRGVIIGQNRKLKGHIFLIANCVSKEGKDERFNGCYFTSINFDGKSLLRD